MAVMCPECIRCRECDGLILCLSEFPITWPCPHIERLCGECLSACEPCAEQMANEMETQPC